MTTCVRKDFINKGRHQGVSAIHVSFIATEAGIDGTVDEIIDDITCLLKTSGNTEALFVNANTQNTVWLVFEGDDPMRHQGVLTDIVSELFKRELFTPRIIIRCGAEYPIAEDLAKFIYDFHVRETYGGFIPESFGASFVILEIDIKLGTDTWENLVDSKAIFSYNYCAPNSYFLFDHDGGKMRWFEIDKIRESAVENDCEMPVLIRPTDELEPEELDKLLGEVFERGHYLG
jgi:hypothetical protein